MIADLRAANAVTERLFATSTDPGQVAERTAAERKARIAESIERWRAWINAHLDETLAQDDAGVERWLPWLFPTGGRSRADPSAPVIGRRELRALVESDPVLHRAIERAFDRMLVVLGLVDRDGRLQWVDAPRPWATESRQDRRVYRTLRSVHNAGLRARSEALMAFLETVARPDALAWYRHQVAS